MKKIVKSSIFIIIFLVSFYIIFHFLWLTKNSVSYAFKEPDNSLDVIYIGSSNVFSSFNTTLAYNKYGFTTGSLTTSLQPFDMVKYLIEEIKMNQSPKLYVIDLFQASTDISEYTEACYRNVIDSMPFNKIRTEAINNILIRQREEDNFKMRVGYYFSFFKYHNKWKDIIAGKSREDKTLYKGFLFSENRVASEYFDNYKWTDEVAQLPDENKEIILDLLDYIKENKLNVLFVISPRTFKDDKDKRLNEVINIVTENNFQVINANNLSDFSIDCNVDLLDYAHVNTKGATMFTLYFAKYLDEKYNLPDHRGDSMYNSWDLEYERLINDYEKVTGKSYEDLVSELDIY